VNRCICLGLLLIIPSLGQADIIPQGYKGIGHDLEITNLKDYPDYQFYAFPKHTDFGRAPALFEAGKTTSISDSNPLATSQLKLYAVPKAVYEQAKGKPLEDWFKGRTAGVLESSERVGHFRTTRSTDPTTRIVTQYEVAIKDGKLTFKQLAEKHYDASQHEVKPDASENPAGPTIAANDGTRGQRWLFYIGVPAIALALMCVFLFFRRGNPV
jgi:hypothetical protein